MTLALNRLFIWLTRVFEFAISNIFTGVPFVLSIFFGIVMLIRSINGRND